MRPREFLNLSLFLASLRLALNFYSSQTGGFMRKLVFLLCLAVFMLSGSLLHATIFGRIQGIVHDPQHRPDGRSIGKAPGNDLGLVANHAVGR